MVSVYFNIFQQLVEEGRIVPVKNGAAPKRFVFGFFLYFIPSPPTPATKSAKFPVPNSLLFKSLIQVRICLPDIPNVDTADSECIYARRVCAADFSYGIKVQDSRQEWGVITYVDGNTVYCRYCPKQA